MTEEPSHRLGEVGSLATFELGQTGDERLVVIRGEIDLSNARHLLSSLEGLPDRRLVVDLTAVSFIDSAGLGVLVRLGASAPAGLQLLVREGSQVDRLLDLTGLKPHFNIENQPAS